MKKHVVNTLLAILVLSPGMLFAQLKPATPLTIRFVNEKGETVYNHTTLNPILIEVNNFDTQQNNPDIRTMSVTLMSETEPLGESIELTETAANSGIFKGKAVVQKAAMPFATNKKLEVKQGDRLTMYIAQGDNSQGISPSHSAEAWFMGPTWNFYNTGSNHIILLPPFAKITIDGEPIKPGDFITVCYNRKSNDGSSLVNAGGMGYNYAPGGVKYTGEATAIAVWGSQEGKNNGMAVGETFKWKIWRASDGKEFDAVATYMSGEVDPNITDTDKFVVDGISGILTLTAQTAN